MDGSRTVEDSLRSEYFGLLPEIRRALLETQTRVQHALLDISLNLERYERLVVIGRVKECESAIDALRRRQSFGLFNTAEADRYTLTALPDLAAVRVMAFPERRSMEARAALELALDSWTYDPVPGVAELDLPLAFKWFGKWRAEAPFAAEVQIVPLLIGSFWEVEHSAIYKPAPNLRGVVGAESVLQKRNAALQALRDFEREFARVIRESENSAGK